MHGQRTPTTDTADTAAARQTGQRSLTCLLSAITLIASPLLPLLHDPDGHEVTRLTQHGTLTEHGTRQGGSQQPFRLVAALTAGTDPFSKKTLGATR